MLSAAIFCFMLALVVSEEANGPAAAAVADVRRSEVCQKYPHLNLCQLHPVLAGAMQELELLLQGEDEEEEGTEAGKEKRKSAFVRFGKRKSAFVRFGKRADQEQEKRKSSYIRFG